MLPQGVHLFQVRHDADEINTGMVSQEEIERSKKFRFENDRNRFLHVRTQLRIHLAEFMGQSPKEIEFQYGEQGKPVLIGNYDIHFNTTHTDGISIISISQIGSVGVDIEKIRPFKVDGVIETAFTPFEKEQVHSSGTDSLEIFFRIWTAKEAYVKAHGAGLSFPIKELEFDSNRKLYRLSGETDPNFKYFEVPVANPFVASLSVKC